MLKRLYFMVPVCLLAFVAIFATMGAARVVQVPCGADLASRVNSDPAGTATRFVLGSCNYNTSVTLKPENGDEIAGPTGTFVTRGPAQDPQPTAVIQGAPGLDQVMKPQNTFHGEWFSVYGGTFTGAAGSGSGIAMGAAAPDSSLYAVVVAHNDGAGITNAHGVFDSIELFDNTQDPAALGFIASGLKAIDEVEVKNSYVHDTQGNGLWCDEFCLDMPTANGKFWIHSNLVVNNGREGIRWERVGSDAASGEALIENNEVHGNGADGRYGIGVRDAANATIQSNTFGAKTIAGVAYPKNKLGAVRASDSGRADRPNLFNVDILNNKLNGEILTGCELKDSIVFCSGNTP